MSVGMFLQRNGFNWTIPLGLLLGTVLRVAAESTLGIPMVRNPVLVQYVVPGMTAILLGWTLQDRWGGCGVPVVRPAWQLAGGRVLASVSVCLGAAGIALIGNSEGEQFWSSFWCLSIAVVLSAAGWNYWWMPVLAFQFVVLRLAGSAPAAVDRITQPLPAVCCLVVCCAAAIGYARWKEQDARSVRVFA